MTEAAEIEILDPPAAERAIKRALETIYAAVDAKPIREAVRDLSRAYYSAGYRARGDELTDAEDEVIAEGLDIAHAELEALQDRLERAAAERRTEAEALEPSDEQRSASERRAAYAHGLASGLAIASKWLARTIDRIPSDDDEEETPS